MNGNVADITATYVTGESWMAKGTSRKHPARNEVAQLAYRLYELRGRQDGYDVEDWLRVEDLLAHGSVATPRCSLTARGEST